MIQVSALEYCLLVFPQFYKEFKFLQKIKAIKRIDDEHCKWLLNNLSLFEYFYYIGPIDSYANKTSTIYWQPVETLFGLKMGSLEEIGKGYNPDKPSEDYKTLKTNLNKYWNAKIKIPERATDLSIYRTLITSTEKRLGRKPTLTDYFIIYDFCTRLFESTWHSILHASVYGSLDDYFGELAFNVYLRKREELSELFIECLEKKFPDNGIHANILEVQNKVFSKVKGIDDIKILNVEEAAEYLHIKPAYLYNLVHYRKITAYKPGGKMLLFKIQDLEKYAFRNRKGDSIELSEQADAILQGNKSRRRKKTK